MGKNLNYLLILNSSQDVHDSITYEVENVENTCQEQRAVFSTAKVYPMAGAVLGTCLGGPVGFLAGVKIGGLAAVGGSIFGKKPVFRRDLGITITLLKNKLGYSRFCSSYCWVCL